MGLARQSVTSAQLRHLQSSCAASAWQRASQSNRESHGHYTALTMCVRAWLAWIKGGEHLVQGGGADLDVTPPRSTKTFCPGREYSTQNFPTLGTGSYTV